MGERQACGREQSAQIVHRAARVDGHISLDELTGRRIDGNLTGHEKKVAGPQGRRIRAGRIRRLRTRDRLFHAAFVTLPDRRQRVQTRIRRLPPPTLARTS